MAFGFPAQYYHIERFQEGKKQEVLDRIKKTLESLKWKILWEDDFVLHAKTPTASFSVGENVDIDIRDDLFGIKSSCVIPTQIIDFGKNKKNIEEFMSEYKTPSTPDDKEESSD